MSNFLSQISIQFYFETIQKLLKADKLYIDKFSQEYGWMMMIISNIYMQMGKCIQVFKAMLINHIDKYSALEINFGKNLQDIYNGNDLIRLNGRSIPPLRNAYIPSSLFRQNLTAAILPLKT